MDYKRFKHISFDLWLTLIKSNPEFKRKRSRLLAVYFDISFDLDHINSTIKKYDILFNRMSEVSGKHVSKDHMWLVILNELGCKIEGLTQQKMRDFNIQAEQLFLENMPVLIDENTDKIFSKITAQGITISLLSNTGFIEGHLLRKLLAGWDLEKYFSFQLYSDETGLAKPGSAAFDSLFYYIQKIKPAHKSEILHVGDNRIADEIGAQNFGLSTLLLNPNQKISMLIKDK
ncbi:MAG TPA: HAD-IA family hydrolase [Niastella sp.]